MADAAGERPVQVSKGMLARILDSDLFYSFRRSKLVVVAAIVTVVMVSAALSSGGKIFRSAA